MAFFKRLLWPFFRANKLTPPDGESIHIDGALVFDDNADRAAFKEHLGLSEAGEDGREVELRTSETHIQWRYEGEAEWTNLVALADLAGDDGDDGEDGWSPVFAVVNDNARRVLKVVDWQGGSGAEPAVNKYVGAAGLVDAIGDGVDIRGPASEAPEIDWMLGERRTSYGATVPAGWVESGTTIGNAASGADRANADTADLFALLWAKWPSLPEQFGGAGIPAESAIVSFSFGAAEDGVFECVVTGASPATITVTFAAADPEDGSHWIDNSGFSTGDDMAAALASYMTQEADGGSITITSLGTGAAESLSCSVLSGLASVEGLPAVDTGVDAEGWLFASDGSPTEPGDNAAADYAAGKRLVVPDNSDEPLLEFVKF